MKEATLKDLKRAYRKAVKKNMDTFKIEKYEFVTGFARYLIEYLEMIGITEDTHLCSLLINKNN